jgi:5'(3')-deoxyribonucleotidase
MEEKQHKGLRHNHGKLRYDLLPSYAMEQIAKVFTFGSTKYADHNWRKGMSWGSVIASMERHLEAVKACDDYDQESHIYHSAHIAANAMFLTEFYKIYPQGDDRVTGFFKTPRVALDIDEVLADFAGEYSKRYEIDRKALYWNFTYEMGKHLNELKDDKDFWMNLPKLRDVPFEPVCYVTSRVIPSEWTMEWLEKNNLPCAPVETVGIDQSKVDALKKHKAEIFVDDRYHNFREVTDAGIFTYLMDASHNQHYNVGHRRLFDLERLRY